MSDFNLKVGTKVDTSTIQKELNAKEYKVTATIVTKGGDAYEKTVRKLKDESGKLYETTELVNKSTGKTTAQLTKVSETAKKASAEIQTASKHTKTLGQDFLSTAGKVAKFGAITSVIGLFTKSMYEAVESVKEMDASLTELKKVSDLSGAGAESYTKDAFNMARDLSTTANNVTDVVALFVQAGNSLDESKSLSKYAIMLQSIADKSMDAETATNFLTSTIKSMNMTVSDAETIINAVNEVSNKFSITSNDLSENIGKIAGTANQAGVSYQQLIGLMTSAVSKGSSASKSANALKSIFVRIQEMSADGSVLKLSKQFDEFGISMTDLDTGKVKDAYTLLQELSVAYQDVLANGNADKQNNMRTLVNDIGGIYNSSVLNNVLAGFSTAIDATAVAMDSAGSAQLEFEKSLDSIVKKAEGTKGAFQELVWGDGGLNSFIKGLLDGTTSILKFMTDTKALNVVLIDLGVILTATLLPKFISLISTITTTIGLMVLETASSKSLAQGLQYVGISATSAQLAMGGLIAVVSIGALAWNAYNAEQEKSKQKSLDNADAINQEMTSIQSAIDLINDEKSSREQIITAVNNVNSAYSDELQAISDVNKLREEAIGLLDEESKKKAEQYTSENLSSYKKAIESSKKIGSAKTGYSKDAIAERMVTNEEYQGTLPSDLKFNIKTDTSGQIEQLESITQTIQNTNGYVEKYSGLLGYAEEKLASLREEQTNTNSIMQSFNDALAIQGLKWNEVSMSAIAMTDAEKEEYQAKQDGMNTAEEYANAIGATTEEFEAQAEALGMTSDEYAEYLNNQKNAKTEAELLTENLEEANDAFSDSISQVGAISDSYSQLSSAVDEYNSSGALSFETLEKLMSLGGDYLSMLSMENGQLVLNKEGFDAIANAKIDDAEAMAYNSAMAQLDALALDQAGNSASTATPKFNGAGIEAYNSGINAANAVGNWQAYWKSVLNEKGVVTSPATLKIGNNLKSQLTMLESARKSIGKYTTATNGSAKANGGATKATKDNTDAIKKQKEALEKLKSNYERAINYIKKKLDEDIDKLEEDKDKALESVDAKIDALNKQRDAEEKYWDDKIDALDEQNDALQTQIELEQKLEAIAKAKSSKVMIYKDGQWQYGQDESAVSSAEQDLYDFQENLKREQQVKDLEAMKDKVLANLDAQIDGWEAYKDNLEKNYDSQIDYLKKYKENFENMVDSYSDAQDKLLAEQLTGINFEKGNWDTRLGNLQTFIAQYNSILSQLDKFDDSALDGGDGSSGGGGGGGSSSSGTKKETKPYTVFQILGSYSTSGQASSNIGRLNGDGMMSYGGAYVVYKKTSKQYTTSGEASSSISKLATPSKYGYKQFASGVSSIDADQMAIVGDDPNKNQELVAGSKASGKLMNLAKGTRVIDNGNTKLLGGLLNTFSKSGFIDSTTGMTTANTNNVSNNNGMTINGGITIMANNPSEFENYFKRYNSNMLQKQFAT